MTEAALLAAVLADPGDDAPRLILADWWDENGQDTRAEFVRVQVELAAKCRHKVPGHMSYCPACRALRCREGEFFTSVSRGKLLGYGMPLCLVDNPQEVGPPGYGFRRGFVFHMKCTAADWLEHGDAILAAHPVEEVTLTTQLYFDRRQEGLEIEVVWRNGSQRGGFRFRGRPSVHVVPDDGQGGNPLRVALLRAEWPRVRHWHLPPPDLHRAFLTATRQIIRDTGGVVQPNVPRIT